MSRRIKDQSARSALVSLLVLCIALAGAGTALGQQTGGQPETLTWSVRPTPTDEAPDRVNFAYDMPAGSTIRDSIRIRNFGNEVLPLVIYSTDALTTPTGALDLLPAGETPTGVGLWISLEPPNAIAPGQGLLLVPGQGFVDVPFTVTVPDNAESGDHVGGIVTSYLSEGVDGSSQPVIFDHRLAIRVQVRVEGDLNPSLEISELTASYRGTANPFSSGVMEVGYTVTNTGNVRLGAEQLVRIRGLFGITGQDATLEAMPELLPGDSLRFSAEIPGVWPTFRTTTEVEITPTPVRPGDTLNLEPAVLATTLWSIPWSQLAVLLVLVGVVLIRRRMRKKTKQRSEEQANQAQELARMVQEAVTAALAAQTAEAPQEDTPHTNQEANEDD